MVTDFENNTWVINYSLEDYYNRKFSLEEDILLSKSNKTITWVNTYGLEYMDEFRKMVLSNELDDFLLRLLLNQNFGNKVIELEEQLFIAARIIKTENHNLESEQMFFVVAKDFVWCIQEKWGDHFDWIRARIFDNKGIIRKKKADYLLFFILETLISNYKEKYEEMVLMENMLDRATKMEPTPEFMFEVENKKALIQQFKKASHGLRDIVNRLERVEVKGFHTKYFSELREQINGLTNDIDSDTQELESQINLFFSIQGHRLNEVMKTLTIFSVIFIPLTFLAGIYGMNFENIPELKWPYGYFVLLGLMLVVTIISILIFKRKKWF
ncbi:MULTISPECIES: CorA family divalent cation transporter [Flavobacteriaceae]|uniref:Magnesium and cobalt transport protein CorA n=1 Tax=Flagellimonas alvinocaridis TaxID=2530200 RepID=A0A4S8RM36_9FLAO|nr:MULTISPECIES: CorA family divalent cation transporter [Allomuricauda]MDC6362967.1 CorA family divalent cation transporter [Muricauda sp. SP22]THV59593.1 magnesium and cobalt transport protein CorA [Allomuricauda alvinocaridis]